MKTIHHVIAAAVDAGLSEPDAEALAKELYSTDKPLAMLDSRIGSLEAQLGDLRKLYEALRDIRGKWGAFNGEIDRVHHNGEDVRPEERLRP